MAEVTRYRPADIVRWLEIGAGTLRAGNRGDGAKDAKGAIAEAVGRVLDIGKSAVADVGARGLSKLEYLLHDDRLEILSSTGRKTVAFADVRRVEPYRGGGCRLLTREGSVSIRPYAWLVVSGVKVPLGWQRNGMEVPFELLPEEIAARAKLTVA